MLVESLQIGGLWLTYFSGAYLLYHLKSYMKDKPLGQQTLLDILYGQLFVLFLVAGFWIAIAFSLISVGHQSWAAAIIFGYGSTTILLALGIHLVICGVLRLVIIMSPETLEEVDDQHIEIATWCVDGLASGLMTGLYYYANSIPPKFKSLLPEVSSSNETIAMAISLTIGSLVICSQGLGRVYIAVKKMNDVGPSNELLSTRTFAMTLAIQLTPAILGELIGFPMYLNQLIYMIGLFIIFPLIVLANHPGAGQQFQNNHPKIKEFMKIIKKHRPIVGCQEDDTESQDQESSRIQEQSIASRNPSATRSRSSSFPNESNLGKPTWMKRRNSISNDLHDLITNADTNFKIVDETYTKSKLTFYNPGRALSSHAMPEINV